MASKKEPGMDQQPQPTLAPPLSFDIWELVAQHLSVSDLKTFSFTCSNFRSVAEMVLWEAPQFTKRVTLAELAAIRCIKLIRELRTSNLVFPLCDKVSGMRPTDKEMVLQQSHVYY